MSDKKDEYRFTIQFNPADSGHKQVSEILNKQGRRKAQYIVNAVLSYINKAEVAASEQPLPLNYHMIEAMVNQILAEKALLGNESAKQNPKHREEEINFQDFDQELGQDDLSAIVDSITAFRKKW